MKNHILWIEDDYYAIQGLVRPLVKAGFEVDPATSAVEGYKKAKNWRSYDLIIVDLILPLSDSDEKLPLEVIAWEREVYVGVGLAKWLLTELKVKCPVLLLSVVRDPITTFHLENIGLADYLPKRGLLPSRVKEEVLKLLGLEG